MDKQKIIEMLNADLEGEHGAIIQYLSHAYGMGEGEMSCEIEALAREEMRHLDWLAETIVELFVHRLPVCLLGSRDPFVSRLRRLDRTLHPVPAGRLD